MSDTPAKSEGGLAYSDNISIAWRKIDHELDQKHLAMVNASNEEFLRAVSVIGDAGGQKDQQEASSGVVAQEVARLDLKVNLLLDLVGTLIYHQLDIPDTSPVRVSAAGVAWKGDVPEPGTTVYLELYIQRGLPKPLCCYGEVVSTAEEHAAGTGKVRFTGLTGAAKSWLEKLIFRHHRREVAFKRSSGE
ncbi:PilZ domain-containing protein [Congregibacter sp.]|uniref:PilZ domain-containing protein n=1 Tax=Congregibacter sp. TaxID=2744308 RepID=UPI003858BCCD